MTQLYTVRLERKRLVTNYDIKGNITSREELKIGECYHDMPFSTADAYRKLFPEANVQIEAQERAVSNLEFSKRRVEIYAGGERKSSVTEAKPKAEKPVVAVAHDYSAVVNSMIKGGA